MMSEFSGLDLTTLSLIRYPEQAARSTLQAWDSADEYLLDELDVSKINNGPLLIFNDGFGALSCALHAYQPISINDSYISELATRKNLQRNQLPADAVTFLDNLSELPAAPSVVIIKIPRTLALLEHQLCKLNQVITPDTLVIAGAKVKEIHTSTLKLFEKMVGETKTSLARKKSRLVFSQPSGIKVEACTETVVWPLDDSNYQIHNYANVFARGALDVGARFFLQHLPMGLSGTVVDLGCGNGVVGMKALALNPDVKMLFMDESYMAVASSRLNVEHNMAADLSRCEFIVENSLYGIEKESLNAVLCNPPFHQQSTITDHLAWEMFDDARRCLKWGGELRIVGNRNLGYQQKLKHLFGNCETIATNKKFTVLKALKVN